MTRVYAIEPAQLQGWRHPERAPDHCQSEPATDRAPTGSKLYGENQGDQPHRRDGRRRDDPDHLEVHQGQADLPLSRHRPDVFRSRHAKARRDARPDHHRCRRGDQEGRRRGEMRHHHAGRSAGEGIQSARDVSLAERHHPQHSRRRHFPRADHLQERAAAGAGLDPADHHRPPRLWRPVSRHRFQGAGQGQALSHLRRRRRQGDQARSVPVSRLRRRHGDVQSRQLDPRFRPRLDEFRL